jgi:hypothetical protein
MEYSSLPPIHSIWCIFFDLTPASKILGCNYTWCAKKKGWSYELQKYMCHVKKLGTLVQICLAVAEKQGVKKSFKSC